MAENIFILWVFKRKEKFLPFLLLSIANWKCFSSQFLFLHSMHACFWACPEASGEQFLRNDLKFKFVSLVFLRQSVSKLQLSLLCLFFCFFLGQSSVDNYRLCKFNAGGLIFSSSFSPSIRISLSLLFRGDLINVIPFRPWE